MPLFMLGWDPHRFQHAIWSPISSNFIWILIISVLNSTAESISFKNFFFFKNQRVKQRSIYFSSLLGNWTKQSTFHRKHFHTFDSKPLSVLTLLFCFCIVASKPKMHQKVWLRSHVDFLSSAFWRKHSTVFDL